MYEFDQILPASRSLSKGRVGCEYFDREVDFVDDALAGAVPAVEQFEVFESVIRADAVDVMDGFFREQVTSEVLGHDIAVLEHRVLHAGDETGYSDPDVAMAFGVFTYFAALKFGQSARSLMCGFAFLVAVFLLFVYAAARFATLRVFFATFEAGKGIARLTGFAATYARALARAVPRIAPIFFMVRSDEILHHEEGFAAFAASEIQRSPAFSWYSFVKAVRTSAREAAIFPVFAREAGKRLLAVFTDFLDRHSLVTPFGDGGTLLMSIGKVK
jgi:hypothetical protein